MAASEATQIEVGVSPAEAPELPDELEMVADAEDMYRLGLKYSTGVETEINLIEAHKWFNLAAVNGSQPAKDHRRELADQMTSADIAAAQRAAREWLSNRKV